MMDLGIIFGLSGMAVGFVSLAYARTQAVNAARLADTTQRAATMEIQTAMMDRIFEIRSQLVNTPGTGQLYLDANPAMKALYPDLDQLRTGVMLRNAIDELQDIYFLRKRGLVDEHHWRGWYSAFVPIARIPATRAIFENAVSRQALEPEFSRFFAQILDGQPAGDPATSTL